MSRGQIIVGALILVSFAVLTGMILYLPKEVPDWLEKLLVTIVGAWIVLATTVVNYLFGSSAGSKSKTDSMNTMLSRFSSSRRATDPVPPGDTPRPIITGGKKPPPDEPFDLTDVVPEDK